MPGKVQDDSEQPPTRRRQRPRTRGAVRRSDARIGAARCAVGVRAAPVAAMDLFKQLETALHTTAAAVVEGVVEGNVLAAEFPGATGPGGRPLLSAAGAFLIARGVCAAGGGARARQQHRHTLPLRSLGRNTDTGSPPCHTSERERRGLRRRGVAALWPRGPARGAAARGAAAGGGRRGAACRRGGGGLNAAGAAGPLARARRRGGSEQACSRCGARARARGATARRFQPSAPARACLAAGCTLLIAAAEDQCAPPTPADLEAELKQAARELKAARADDAEVSALVADHEREKAAAAKLRVDLEAAQVGGCCREEGGSHVWRT